MSARASHLLLLVGLGTACASREAGIEVQVDAEVVAGSAPHVSLARLSLTGVRGVPCSELMATRWSPVSSAWAHGALEPATSPLSATLSLSLDLTAAGTTPLATLRPPPGLWCALELSLAPSASDEPWGGTTLLVDAEKGGVSRRYLATGARTTQRTFLPLSLSASERRHHLRLRLEPAAVLSSLEPSAPDARRDLLDGLLASLTLAPEPSE